MLIGLTGVLLLAGCSGPGPYRAERGPNALEEHETVVILSKSLAKRIKVEGQRADRLPDNRLQVHANIRNYSKEPVQVQVQTVFKDRDAISLDDETTWKPVLMTEGGTYTYTESSMTDKAEFYTIRIREER
jgi:uncharacterized protein YcfL